MSEEEEIFFTIKTNKDLGRFAIANKNLKPGDFIFAEKPFAYGPKSDSPPICLGCHSRVDCSILCSKCSWPVCGEQCESLAVHKEAECPIFSAARVKFQPLNNSNDICLQLECITPLRVLLAKERDPKRWLEEIELMESHDNIRQTKEIWRFNEINIVNYLRGPCKLSHFPSDLIHKICGILEINAFEARTQSGNSIRCLYPKLAILSHNCVSNITHSIDCNKNWDQLNDFTVKVRAAIEIKENTELFSSYTYSLWPTLIRREFLKESKYFDCKCERCCDKTELGTNMSTLKCSQCGDNGTVLSTNPLNDDCEWHCTNNCGFKTHSNNIRKLFAIIQNEIDSSHQSIEAYEAIFKKYSPILHPNNAYLTTIRSILSQLYNKTPTRTLEGISSNLLEHKIENCRQLLKVLDIIEPGHSRIRGVTLYELHSLMIQLAKHECIIGCISKGQFLEKLMEIRKLLQESVDILCNEPPNSVEGSLGRIAQNALVVLNGYCE